MGKFDALLKALGVAAKDVGDDAAEALARVKTPEVATGLKGEARKQYLDALDSVYGDQATRRKGMGFGDETYYHGTKKKFDKFDPSQGGSSGGGAYLTKNKSVAKNFTGDNGVILHANIKETGNLNLDEPEKIAEMLGIKDEFLGKKFRSGNQFYDLMGAYEKKNPSAFDGLKGTEREDKFTEILKANGANSLSFSQNGIEDYATNVLNPKDIRSVKAAFDPRFKDSPLLMAGAGAVPMAGADVSPIEPLKAAYGYYDKLKNMFTDPLAEQLDLTKDRSAKEGIKSTLNMAADPINLVPGPAGLALGLGQAVLTPDDEAKNRALDKLMRGE